MLKRITSILLLIALTYSFVGAGFVYNVWLFSIKKQVRKRLDNSFGEEELKLVKVPASWDANPPAFFQWFEDDEFRYRGQMYDLVRREQHGNEMWYYCYWDKAETELLNNLSEYVASYLMQNPHQQKKDVFLKTFLSKTLLFVSTKMNFDLGLKVEYLASYRFNLPSVFLDINLPPPRISVSS